MSAFKQMIVTDVILDSAAITDKYAAFLKENVANLNGTIINAKNIPRNSILARSIHASEGTSQATSNLELVLPFFSAHICPPVKPGEVVWVFLYDSDEPLGQKSIGYSNFRRMQMGQTSVRNLLDESIESASGFRVPDVGYWIGRVSSFMQFEDTNYTVFSRAFGLTLDNQEGEYPDKNEKYNVPKGDYFRTAPNAENNPNVPSLFTNGAGVGQPRIIEPVGTIDDIFNNATANGVFEFEPVPRFTKRPGDLVLQGSNNTLISLGIDRTGPIGVLNTDESGLPFPILSGSDASKVEEDFVQFAGTIDIVTGRGRGFLVNSDGDPELTSARVINTDAQRGENRDNTGIAENDKDPEKSDNKKPNLNEGNPDFVLDSSRMYVSMRTNGDKNFALPQPPITDNSPADFYTEGEDGELAHIPTDEEGTPFIITKSDEIRIIARKNEKDEPVDGAPEINGSIKIVKEGDVGEDLAMIIMHPDGTVQIDAPRIILGRNDVGAFDDGAQPGSDTETGYVKFSQYNVQMSALHDEVTRLSKSVKNMADGLNTILNAVETVFQSAMAGPFPVVSLQGLGSATIISTMSELLIKGTDQTAAYEIADAVSSAVGGDDTGSGGTGLKDNIPDARSDTIFGE